LSKLIADSELRQLPHFGELPFFVGAHFSRHAKSPPFSRCSGRHCSTRYLIEPRAPARRGRAILIDVSCQLALAAQHLPSSAWLYI
jgi:hypothetical protein